MYQTHHHVTALTHTPILILVLVTQFKEILKHDLENESEFISRQLDGMIERSIKNP